MISQEALKRLKMKVDPASSFVARGADKSSIDIIGCVTVELRIGEATTKIKLAVMRGMSVECIIGREVISSHPNLRNSFVQMLDVGDDATPDSSFCEDSYEMPDLVWDVVTDSEVENQHESFSFKGSGPLESSPKIRRLERALGCIRALFKGELKNSSPKRAVFRNEWEKELVWTVSTDSDCSETPEESRVRLHEELVEDFRNPPPFGFKFVRPHSESKLRSSPSRSTASKPTSPKHAEGNFSLCNAERKNVLFCVKSVLSHMRLILFLYYNRTPNDYHHQNCQHQTNLRCLMNVQQKVRETLRRALSPWC